MEKTHNEHPGLWFIVITGCSGGGKSTLLEELRRRGYATIREAGRQVVQEQVAMNQDELPWENIERFAELCIGRNLSAYEALARLTFFDRSLLDNICALDRLGRAQPEHYAILEQYRYSTYVFLCRHGRRFLRRMMSADMDLMGQWKKWRPCGCFTKSMGIN